ncbi:MAG: threonine--tRNA ligase, partial [Oscillospiraceae bacterium]|nr:threonine--tRNA ligase [Oscillospiraceae bacterium]
GTAEQWNEAQRVMGEILDAIGIDYEIGIDEAAFYGPKLDIQCKNVFGKEDTIVTIQIDMLLAQKFGMEYVDTDGEKKTPYIIHRTSMGCYERTLALLLEKYAGALPLWLSPLQVKIMPISDRQLEFAEKLAQKMDDLVIRCEIDNRSEKIGYKIRQAQLDKTPYMVIIGDKEVENNEVSVRNRREGELGSMSPDALVARLLEEIASKAK